MFSISDSSIVNSGFMFSISDSSIAAMTAIWFVVVSQVASELKELHNVVGVDTDEFELYKVCEETALLGHTTVYECELASGIELRGLQRRKHFGEAAAKWATSTNNRSPSEYVHPLLLKLTGPELKKKP